MSPLEIAAFAFGLANVTLVVLRSIWNYPFGIVMVALYALIFAQAKLYSDALLQIFFLLVQLYGWWNWARAKAESGEVTVLMLSWRSRLQWAAGCAVATLVWGWLMHTYTDAAFPWWDASIAMMSVAAQILMSRRYIENWWLWIAVDAAAVPLYAVKDLWLTSGLYVVFGALSVWGLIEWLRAGRREAAVSG